jgi:hypothetical protein
MSTWWQASVIGYTGEWTDRGLYVISLIGAQNTRHSHRCFVIGSVYYQYMYYYLH